MSAFNFFGADMSAVLQPRATAPRKQPTRKPAAKPSSKGKPRRNSQANVDEFMRLTGALKGAFPAE